MSAERVLVPLWEVFCRPFLYSILKEQVFSRPWEYSILQHHVLCRASRYLRELRKYSISRESISAVVFSTLSAVRVLHHVVSETVSAVEVLRLAASRTLSAVRVFHPAASRTLSAVMVLAQNEEAFCRLTECSLQLRLRTPSNPPA